VPLADHVADLTVAKTLSVRSSFAGASNGSRANARGVGKETDVASYLQWSNSPLFYGRTSRWKLVVIRRDRPFVKILHDSRQSFPKVAV